MKRTPRLVAATVAAALLAVLAPAVAASAASDPGNSQVVPSTVGVIVIPAGDVVTLSGAAFSACDALQYGYQLNFGPNVPVDSKGPVCTTIPASGAQFGPFISDTTLRIFLTDVTCSDTFYSDGVHALVTGSNPLTVDITDSGICTSGPSDPRPPGGPGQGNLTVTVTIAPFQLPPLAPFVPDVSSSSSGGSTLSASAPVTPLSPPPVAPPVAPPPAAAPAVAAAPRFTG
jgi:hypothetical protein